MLWITVFVCVIAISLLAWCLRHAITYLLHRSQARKRFAKRPVVKKRHGPGSSTPSIMM